MSLKIKEISVQVGRKRVLRNVSFGAEEGDVTGICGWSGSGKTTLLKVLAGLLPVESGTITFNLDGVPDRPLIDNARYVPAVAEIARWRSIFGSARMPNIADGKRQMIAIENALQSGRKVILLDNAVSFMDRRARNGCFAKLREEARTRRLVIVFATSDFDEILRRCDRVAILDEGEIAQSGRPQAIYESPVTKSVAELTGRNNIFEVRRLSSSKADTQEFQTITGGHRLFAKRLELSSMGALNQNTFLAIRPEQVSISFGASFPEDNLLKATIVGTHFLGPATLVSIDCGGLPIDALVPRLVGLEIGEECIVGLPPDRLRILNK